MTRGNCYDVDDVLLPELLENGLDAGVVGIGSVGGVDEQSYLS